MAKTSRLPPWLAEALRLIPSELRGKGWSREAAPKFPALLSRHAERVPGSVWQPGRLRLSRVPFRKLQKAEQPIAADAPPETVSRGAEPSGRLCLQRFPG